MAIFVVDEDVAMADCVRRACLRGLDCSDGGADEVFVFSNGIDAILATDEVVPDLIFLEILLLGPDGFAFLSELRSYRETADVPVVVVSAVDFRGKDLSAYGVVGVLNKETMRPEEVTEYVRKYA